MKLSRVHGARHGWYIQYYLVYFSYLADELDMDGIFRLADEVRIATLQHYLKALDSLFICLNYTLHFITAHHHEIIERGPKRNAFLLVGPWYK